MKVLNSKVPFVDLTYQHQPINEDMQAAIATVLANSDFVMGQSVKEFEVAFSHVCEAAYGIGVGSGTDAITLGLKACGIGEGDEVILPTNTFIATLVGILQSGATPVFVDCDPNTGLIDLSAAKASITSKTRGIIPVHLYGQMVSPKALLTLAAEHDLIIFEDAAQAHLAERENYTAGSIGRAAAFSFYPSKNLGGIGDGGIVVTQDATVAGLVRSLRNYGASSKYVYSQEGGTNSRLDTLQAAILNLKLPLLPDWNEGRRQIAQLYNERLATLNDLGLIPLTNESGHGHVYHLYVVRVTSDCPINRSTLQQALREQGIQTGIHYPVPCHMQVAFKSLGYQSGDFPVAETLSEEIISLPIYPGMTVDQVDQVVAGIEKAMDM